MPAFSRVEGQRCKALILALVMIMFIMIPLFSSADGALPSAGERNPTIRVLLSRMNLSDRLDVTLISPYILQTEEGLHIRLHEKSQLSFLLRYGQIYLHYEGLTLNAGSELSLLRMGMNAENESGFYRTNFAELYVGDLSLCVEGEILRPVLSMHIEDYLLGVVPYEMSETFPVEALKAQAIAARTYALKKQNSDRAYDVVDTTNDQVFKGYLTGNEKSEQAVRKTVGICGFYKGKLAQCYYSASNGGQMELVETVWPTSEDFGYYSFGDDPYDLANPESVVRSFELTKTSSGTLPYELNQLLIKHLVEQFPDFTPDTIRIDQVQQIELKSPSSKDSKLYTVLSFTVQLSTRTKREYVPIADNDTEEVSIFLVDAPTVSAASTTLPVPDETPAPSYGSYQPTVEPVTLDIPIFPDAEYALGMDISGNFDNEIWSITEKSDRFVIEARRYGHGVGMSQRGAQQMASAHDKTYQEIMSFYYPGLQLKRFEYQEIGNSLPDPALAEDAGPAASPTPRPTLMPLTQSAAKGQWYATVTEIADDSSLNLRSEPNLSSEIRMRLYKNQRLLVLERCPQEGWVKVQTDTADGYVMEKYLTKEQ